VKDEFEWSRRGCCAGPASVRAPAQLLAAAAARSAHDFGSKRFRSRCL
jgi:hypothetical protein